MAKGSKNIRNILYKAEISRKKIDLTKSKQVKKFFELIEVPVPNKEKISFYMSLWSCHFLPNKIREFGYKFFNNTLGINTRVAHFNANIGTGCTFCSIRGRGEEGGATPDESFLHLFHDCNHVKKIRMALTNRFFNEISNLSDEDKKLFWFCGSFMENNNITTGITALVINFYIWECKLRKTPLSVASLMADLEYTMGRCFALSRKARLGCKKINFQLFRNWSAVFGVDDGRGEGEEEEEEQRE
jgi:hypothetical protein